MTYVFTIPGTLPGLNQYIDSKNRKDLKQQCQRNVCKELRMQSKHLKLKEPIEISYQYFEPNAKRDKDNISSFAHKVIQDALVACHMIKDDGWNNIKAFEDCFAIDRHNPRIVLYIKEAE